MSVELYRIDDRLIHGQVVVGWGKPLDVGFIVLVDDAVASSTWEQDLYRIGAPPGMELYFETVAEAQALLATHQRDPRAGIVLTGDIASMRRLLDGTNHSAEVNLGGIHHKAGRTQRLRYLFLSPDEEDELRQLAARGIRVTARDLPSARPVELTEIVTPRRDA